MELHLIRHGKTLANEQKLYCGQTDLPLSITGEEEIAMLKSQGIYPPAADIFFTSGLLRAEQTLDIIYGNVPRKAICDIAEFKFGLFEMKSYEELKEREDFKTWINDETGDYQCPCGESKKQFEQRVVDGFNGILNFITQINVGSAFAVCHGGTIACIMEYLCPNTRNFYEWQPEPGRGYTFIQVLGRLQVNKNI
jgi:alpha-ribazole phosphatase